MGDCSACQAGGCQHELTSEQHYNLFAIAALATILPIVIPWCSGTYSRGADPELTVFVPSTWLWSGLGVVIFILAAGFNGEFFILINDPASGCAGPIGGCGTISCIAGTYLPEAYVFMQLTLSMIPVLFTIHIWTYVKDRPVCTSQRVLVVLLAVGITMISLTGIFPARYATNPLEDPTYNSVSRYRKYGAIHTFGVSVGCAVVVFVSYVFFLFHYGYAHRREGRNLNAGLCARTVYLLVILFAYYLFIPNQTAPDTLDYCATLKTRSACNSWLRKNEQCPEVSGISFRCGWQAVNFTENQKVMLPKEDLKLSGMCVRQECMLYNNAFSIVAEYAVLFLSVTYGITFATSNLELSFTINGETNPSQGGHTASASDISNSATMALM